MRQRRTIGASASRLARYSTKSRKVGSAQCTSSKTAIERPVDRKLLEDLADGGEGLVARALEHGLVPAGLSQDLAQGPERDAFSVGRAASDETAASRSIAVVNARASRDLPIPGSPTIITNRLRRRPRLGELVSQLPELLDAADERRVESARDRCRVQIDGLESQAVTGRLFPFRISGSSGSAETACATSR